MKSSLKITLLLVAVITLTLNAKSQHENIYTNYNYNILAVNPAYAGNRGVPSATLIHRSMWLGFTQRGRGAMETQTASFHTPVKNKNLGIGFSCINDRFFPLTITALQSDFSYKINLDSNRSISMGIKTSLKRRHFNTSLLILEDKVNPDPAFTDNNQSLLTLNFGTGFYFRNRSGYLGISVTNLRSQSNGMLLPGYENFGSEPTHWYIIAGTKKRLSPDFQFKPSLFLKVSNKITPEMDITARLEYAQKIQFGVAYRTGDAISILAGANVFKHLKIGYSYDWSYTSRHLQFNNGSHELVLRYDIHKKQVIIEHRPKFP